MDAGEVFVKIWVIRQVGDDLLTGQRLVQKRMTINYNIALFKVQYPYCGAEGCGLARAVMSNKPKEIAIVNAETQVIHRFFSSISLGQVFYAQNFTHYFSPPSLGGVMTIARECILLPGFTACSGVR